MSNMFGGYQTHLSVTMQAASTTVLAAAQTLGGAGNMTLTANNSTTDGMNHEVTVTCSGADMSGVNFTVTGTDKDNSTLTETIVGPNHGSVHTSNYFSTVTSIAADGAVGTNTSAGFSALATSRRIPIEQKTGSFNIGIAVVLNGTSTFDVDVTYDDIYANSGSPLTTQPTYFTPSAFSGKSASLDGTLLQPCTALRLRTESYTSTPTLTLHVIQNKSVGC